MERVSKREPLISVIVPIYNVEEYLDKCINSILNQTYKNLEIILVDDGSPDNCPKMCDEYAKKDNRIKVIHKKNGGLSDARNKGIEIANGDYIGFVDSDDWILPTMYESLLSILLKYNADISVCELIRSKSEEINIKKKKETIVSYSQKDYIKKFFKIRSQSCEYYAWNKLYKKNIVEEEMYPKGLTSEDVLGTYKAILNSKTIVKTSEILYVYRINSGGITGKFSNKDYDLLNIWDKVIDETKKRNKTEYLDYAKINRKRINFTLLYRMGINIPTNELKKNEISNKLLIDLKNDEKDLLKSKIKFNRKILIFLFCRNYYLCVKILRHILRLKKK